MKYLLTIAVAVCSIPSSLFCQPGLKPVPAKWLHDGRLVVPELTFSIASPTPDAKWFFRDDLPKVDGNKSTAFFVDAGDGSKYVVAALENSSKMESTDHFTAGMRKTLPKDWQIRDAYIERSDVPLKDSRKFKVTITLPDGATYYTYGYIVSGSRTFQTMTFSASPGEPTAFTHFAQSFALLNANVDAPFPNISGIFLLWATWGAIVNWRYVKRGGVRTTRSDKLYLLVAVGLGLALIVLFGVRGASAYSLGSMIGTIGTLIFSLWEVALWRVRRKNPLPVVGFQSSTT